MAMDWTWYLFSFEGRINRGKFWLAGLIIVCWMIFLLILLFVPLSYLFGEPQKLHIDLDNIFAVFDPQSYRGLSRSDLGSVTARTIILPLCLWVFLAAAVKRLHDRDRSGWWIIPFFVGPGLYNQFSDRLPDSYLNIFFTWPIAATYLWGMVELYFLPGTRWTNRFGANPLGKQQMRPRSATTRLRATTSWDQQGEIEMTPHTGSPPPGMHVNRGT
jgi:uncharacterized membrane protein YhaH (DUF805 family)